jgi:hypothetical protein
MNIKSLSVAVAMLSLAAFGGNAHAGEDGKVYPGNACQFREPGKVIFEPDVSFALGNGAITNVANIPVSVVCPVVRDNTKNTNGTGVVNMRVRGSQGQAVFCTLASRGRFGEFVKDQGKASGPSGNQVINLDVAESAVDGSYHIDCLLPPGGQILTYRVVEVTPTVEVP